MWSTRVVVVLASLAIPALAQAHVTPEQLQELYAQPSPFESIPRSKWIAESPNAFVVHDINPQAPVHLLVIPKKRVPSLLEASPTLVAEMLALATRVARQEGIAQDGFRIIINTHPYGGQSVYHFHIHVLGGRELGWSPGFRNEATP
ncbi:MAG: HIT domain-containing protein [Terriglobia bacterium]